MNVWQIGNGTPPHSTENELLDALRRLSGVEVTFVQEESTEAWAGLLYAIRRREPDLILWTSTVSLADQVGFEMQYRMLDMARRAGIPTVGYHLDRWWGLKRQNSIERPFFSCSHLFTADGGHQPEFAAAGINHTWMPPAISERWCYLGTPRPEFECDIAFVGGWYGYGHTEWTHRHEMIERVARRYGNRFKCFPERGQPRITMGDLNDLYASAKVVIGDSCLAPKVNGSPMTHYCSDRIPETMGRGGILIHPRVEGVTGPHEEGGIFDHLWWELGDWRDLCNEIDGALADGEYSIANRTRTTSEIKAAQTYAHRMRDVLTMYGWSE